uniref:alpha-1,2-Mannosidase n=1 Tax=Oryza nivara TaxID=4536 RepID=A0A0E0FTU3_ORYNI
MPTSGPDAMQPALRRRRRRQGFLLPFACLSAALIAAALLPGAAFADGVTPSEARRLRDEVKDMFYHAFDGYMQHAFPLDELRPLSCQGEDSLGGYALTLIDSLDTLALLGDKERFDAAVEWVGKNVRFDINKTVSVFETNIRILGGLLSAHLIASDYATGMRIQSYDDQLLHLAADLAQRLLPAFDTPTELAIRNRPRVWTHITSTAGGGTLTLEFGVLSRLTNDSVYERVTKNSVRGIWARRSKLDLVGAHINVFTGEWTQKDAGIGTSIDSFYEYLLKEAYKAAMHYLHHDPWYVEVNMNSGATVWPLFNSLQAFWPGLQNGQRSYPLRPELIESTYWLFKATRDYRYLDVGRDILASLQYGAKCPCGYCHISDVETHQQDDHMESFFLAETVKYLWLLFDLAAGPDNIVENGPYKYIFSTEGHLLPATPQITLLDEHCLYAGAFCNGTAGHGYGTGDSSNKHQNANSVPFDDSRTPSDQSLSNILSTTRGYIKGVCPGLTHAQKLGISYSAEEDNSIQQNSGSSENLDESHVIKSSVQAQSSSVILISHPVASQTEGPTSGRSQYNANIVATAESVGTDTAGASSHPEDLVKETESVSEQKEINDKEIASQGSQPTEGRYLT